MKKTTSFILTLIGIFSFSQTSILVIDNQNNHFDAQGRFFTASPTTYGGHVMFAFPNASFGVYTIPSLTYHKYPTFDNSGGLGNIMDIDTWNVYDPYVPANSGPHAYNDPMITTMNGLNQWAGYIFTLNDNVTGSYVDSYSVGDPAVASNAGFTVNSSQTGPNSGVYSDWYTITAGSDQITFFTIYP